MHKKITILHANDLHGQLSFTVGKDFKLYGGISMLKDYVTRCRREHPTFFGICGDILQEDVWGSDYKGTNTVSLINLLRPDALSLGNHELDYGLSHLMIFKECIQNPVLCCNIWIKKLDMPLFQPSRIYEVDGVRLLVIGIIPDMFFRKIVNDAFCRDMTEYHDSYEEIRREQKKNEGRYDLCVLMSHYGLKEDEDFLNGLPEDIRVDLLLGGHSHVCMDEAKVVRGIPMAQSSYGTTHIGRFELNVDLDAKKITDYTWQRVELSEENCGADREVDELADKVVFQRKKESRKEKIATFAAKFEHKSRLYETQLGKLVADAFLESYPVELVILQSGSLRSKECGPEVTEKDLRTLYPFDDAFMKVPMSGKMLRDAFDYLFMLKPDGTVMNGTFVFSKGFYLKADFTDCWHQGCRVLELALNGEPIEDDRIYQIGVTKNCLSNFAKYFGMPSPGPAKTLSFSTFYDLAKWVMTKDGEIEAPKDERFVILNYEEGK
ncbi:MAG: 5'-nucleotidase C-terminal domain-containing protein [Acetatifactor sp.]|nr:5'-nucleotidase C-terminal domain-containing protein [Acetatifactor sp.]